MSKINEYEFGLSVKARHDEEANQLNFGFKFLHSDAENPEQQVPTFLLEYAISCILEVMPKEDRAKMAAAAVAVANTNQEAARKSLKKARKQ